MHSTKAGSIGSLDSLRSSDPFSKSPRIARRHLAEIPEGPSKFNPKNKGMVFGIWFQTGIKLMTKFQICVIKNSIDKYPLYKSLKRIDIISGKYPEENVHLSMLDLFWN